MVKNLDLFNECFLKIINFCFLFNSLNNNRFVHITGGASIKYHMIINGIENHENITDIISLILITNNKDIEHDINNFFNGLLTWFTNDDLIIKNNKDSYIISILEEDIINIKIFDEKYFENNKNNYITILKYAITKLNYVDFYDYFKELEKLNIKNKTISTLELEKYSCVKGINLQVPNTTYLKLLKNPDISEKRKKAYRKLYEKNNDISYNYKLDIINKMI